MTKTNDQGQLDLTLCIFILTDVDVASRYKVFQCDNGSEFKSDVTKLLKKNRMSTFGEKKESISTLTHLRRKHLSKS